MRGVPFPGVRYGAAFVAGGAAQELASLSLLGDDYAGGWAAAPAEDWLAVHELSHQWWGNAATCATWGDDFWIQEAFAVFMTAAYKQRRWGEPAYQREPWRAQSSDALATSERISADGLILPLYVEMTDEEESRVVSSLERALAQ